MTTTPGSCTNPSSSTSSWLRVWSCSRLNAAPVRLAPDRVELVDEDDGRRVLAGGLEELADARRAHAGEHLDEARRRLREERGAALVRDRLRQQRLAGAGRPVEEDALGHARAEGRELLGLAQELHDLAQLVLRLVRAGHVDPAHARVAVGLDGLRLGARHHGHHPPHQVEQRDQQEDRQPQQGRLPRRTPLDDRGHLPASARHTRGSGPMARSRASTGSRCRPYRRPRSPAPRARRGIPSYRCRTRTRARPPGDSRRGGWRRHPGSIRPEAPPSVSVHSSRPIPCSRSPASAGSVPLISPSAERRDDQQPRGRVQETGDPVASPVRRTPANEHDPQHHDRDDQDDPNDRQDRSGAADHTAHRVQQLLAPEQRDDRGRRSRRAAQLPVSSAVKPAQPRGQSDGNEQRPEHIAHMAGMLHFAVRVGRLVVAERCKFQQV